MKKLFVLLLAVTFMLPICLLAKDSEVLDMTPLATAFDASTINAEFNVEDTFHNWQGKNADFDLDIGVITGLQAGVDISKVKDSDDYTFSGNIKYSASTLPSQYLAVGAYNIASGERTIPYIVYGLYYDDVDDQQSDLTVGAKLEDGEIHAIGAFQYTYVLFHMDMVADIGTGIDSGIEFTYDTGKISPYVGIKNYHKELTEVYAGGKIKLSKDFTVDFRFTEPSNGKAKAYVELTYFNNIFKKR